LFDVLLVYGAWSVLWKRFNRFGIFEKRVLSGILGPVEG